jgi:hypothetical protein
VDVNRQVTGEFLHIAKNTWLDESLPQIGAVPTGYRHCTPYGG